MAFTKPEDLFCKLSTNRLTHTRLVPREVVKWLTTFKIDSRVKLQASRSSYVKYAAKSAIPADLIKHLTITPTYEKELRLLRIINRIGLYDEGTLPEDFKAVNFVPIPKKNNSQKCSDL